MAVGDGRSRSSLSIQMGKDMPARPYPTEDSDTAAPDPNDELSELLEELRVMLPGTEVIFGFLLTVPFSNGFTQITRLQESTYFVAVVAAALSTMRWIAPSAIHRIERHPSDAELRHLLKVSTTLAIAGSFILAIALTAVVFLITDIVYDAPAATLLAAIVAGVAVCLWFVYPLIRRLRARA